MKVFFHISLLGIGLFFNTASLTAQNANRVRGKKVYELNNHLGNVLATVADRRTGVDDSGDGLVDCFMADLISGQDYYAFGMIMPGRVDSSYRFGFNGMEKEKNLGTKSLKQFSFFRIYGTGIGRWWSIDPKSSFNITPYASMDNNPIFFIDPQGDDIDVSSTKNIDDKTKDSSDDYTQQIIEDWEYIAGLNITVNESGTLSYTFDAENDRFSETARKHLVERIDDTEHTYTFEYSDEDTKFDDYKIKINPAQIASFIEGSSPFLNEMTMGFGMSALHELLHAPIPVGFGPHVATPVGGVQNFGYVDDLMGEMNIIRFEIDANNSISNPNYSFGSRLSYIPQLVNGIKYLPFDFESYDRLLIDKNNPLEAPIDGQKFIKIEK